MRATVFIGGGAASEVMTVTGEKGDPFVVLGVRDREILLSRSEARMASDALRALALLGDEVHFRLPM
jgi:hypothetical protein